MFAGGTITLIRASIRPKALEIIPRDKVSVFEGVPTMYTAMLNLDGKGDHDVLAAGLRLGRIGDAG